ncbi:MAG TPA: CAP domain-containing protein [Pyrinomonadaceae bacterium]
MRRFRLLFPLLAFAALCSPAFGPRGTSARQLNAPKAAAAAALEQEVLQEINLARTRPAEYAAYLEQLRTRFDGREYRRPGRPGLMTAEGAAALEEAIGFLRAAKPLPPLSLSDGMCSGARELVRDQAGTDATGHKAADGSFCEQRAKRFGTWMEPIGENLSYSDDTARERVITLLVDDGFASRGHRKRIFDASFRVAGVACGDHKLGAMCVITLAGGFSDAAKAARPATHPAAQPLPAGAKRF